MANQGLPAIGSKMGFTATAPTDETSVTDRASLTYISSEELVTIGELGGSRTVLSYTPVGSGVIVKLAGALDNGEQATEYAAVADDPVQLLLKAHYKSGIKLFVTEELPDGTKFYYDGIVTTATTAASDAGQVVMFKSNIAVSGDIYEVAPTP